MSDKKSHGLREKVHDIVDKVRPSHSRDPTEPDPTAAPRDPTVPDKYVAARDPAIPDLYGSAAGDPTVRANKPAWQHDGHEPDTRRNTNLDTSVNPLGTSANVGVGSTYTGASTHAHGAHHTHGREAVVVTQAPVTNQIPTTGLGACATRSAEPPQTHVMREHMIRETVVRDPEVRTTVVREPTQHVPSSQACSTTATTATVIPTTTQSTVVRDFSLGDPTKRDAAGAASIDSATGLRKDPALDAPSTLHPRTRE